MGKRSIELYVRAQAVALYRSGLNLSKISKQLQVCRCCVRNAITKFQEYTKFDDMKRSGRSKSLSDCNIRELKRLDQDDNRLSAAKITTDLRPYPPQKKSVFVKKFEIEITAWEDSPSFALSETLWFFIGLPFFDEVFSRFLSSSIKKRDFFLEKGCFEVFARNFR